MSPIDRHNQLLCNAVESVLNGDQQLDETDAKIPYHLTPARQYLFLAHLAEIFHWTATEAVEYYQNTQQKNG